jgi:Zn finger protein HypA/HybF involved in hydrogenase expression
MGACVLAGARPMHELSIALEVCRLVETRTGPGAANVTQVGIEVGDASGFEAANLEFCLDALFSRPPFGRAKAVILRTPGDDLRLTYLEIDE